jgi:hypothetical protein
MEPHMGNKPADEQQAAGKLGKLPAVKKHQWKLNAREVGAQARVIHRERQRTELIKSEAMWRPLLLLAGAVLLIVVASWTADKERQKLQELLVRPDSFASISATTDGVLIQQGGSTVTATAGMQICDGDIFLTGTNSETTVRYVAGSTVMILRSNTLVKLHQQDGRFIELGRGNIAADVAKQPEGTNMVFMTPYAEVTVTEARLDLRVTAEFARIEVRDGEARVRRTVDHKATIVPAGKYAVATEKSRLKIGSLPPGDVNDRQPPEAKVIVIP